MRTLLLFMLLAPLMLMAELQWEEEMPGNFSASVKIPKTTISIDENLILELTLKYPKTHTPDLDTVRMNLLRYVGVTEPPFALKNEKIDEIEEGKIKVTFEMEPQLAKLHFVSLYNIPFISIDEESKDVQTLFSDIFEIEVYLPEIDPGYRGYTYGLLSLTEPLPIGMNLENQLFHSDPERLTQESQRSASIVAARTIPWTGMMGVLLFCVVLFIVRMQPKKAPDPAIEIKKRAVTARERALLSLNALDSSQKEAFYVDLTNTVRRFIEEKYQIEATKQTTQEFLYAMTYHPTFDRETQAMLSDFMVSSDRVKFADQEPTEEACLEARQTAEQFISSH